VGWARPLAALVVVAALEPACGGQAEDPAGTSEAPPSPPTLAAPQPTRGSPPATRAEPPRAAPPAAPDTAPPPGPMIALPAPEPPIPPVKPEMEPEPAVSISVDGCVEIGAYVRAYFFQRDEASGTCAELGLVELRDEPSAFDLTTLSLPPRWEVESMSAFRCTPEGALLSGTIPTEYLTASGSVAFGLMQGAIPLRATLAVTIRQPVEDADPSPDPLITSQAIAADDLDLQGSCPSR
jgi:hypothetical protein